MSIVKVLTAVWRRYTLEVLNPDEELVMESVGIGEKQGPLMVRARLRTEQSSQVDDVFRAVG